MYTLDDIATKVDLLIKYGEKSAVFELDRVRLLSDIGLAARDVVIEMRAKRCEPKECKSWWRLVATLREAGEDG